MKNDGDTIKVRGRPKKKEEGIKVNIRMSKELYMDLLKLTEIANIKEPTNLSDTIRKCLTNFVRKNRGLIKD